MVDNNWRDRFSVSDGEMERLQRATREIARAQYDDDGSQIDSVSVTFHFIVGPGLRLLEVSVGGSEPIEISDDDVKWFR